MPHFRYRALSVTGARIAGRMEAASEADAIRCVRSLGHYPICAVLPAQEGWRQLFTLRRPTTRRVSLHDLAIATQELATLLHAGLDLDRALGIVSTLKETKTLRQPLTEVRARMRDGMTFSDALSAVSVFPKLFVNMVRAGEIGNQLEKTLARLADYHARGHAVRESLASALVYPIILLCTAGLSLFVILVFVLPQFEPLFADAGKSLPLSTRIVMAAGHFLGAWWWLMALGGAGLMLWVRKKLQETAFRRRSDALVLKLPLFGVLSKQIDMERFSRTLGTLLIDGVPLPHALGITKDVVVNSLIAEAIGDTALKLREGEGLADRLSRTKMFPSVTLDFVRIGEESGTLPEMLLRQADLYERSIKHTIDRMLALLVPVLTIGLGMMVAGLIASLLVAILSINDLAL